jgi:hypothetical protein
MLRLGDPLPPPCAKFSPCFAVRPRGYRAAIHFPAQFAGSAG